MKTVFMENNIEITEETLDVVSDLEEELEAANKKANDALNESIELKAKIDKLEAAKVFEEVCEGLADTQIDRMKRLAEKLDVSDLDAYSSDLTTLKETFFSKEPVITEEIKDEPDNVIVEEEEKVVSEYDTVNALAEAFRIRADREK